MRLGKMVQINIGIANLESSLAFYSTLGYQTLSISDEPYPWARITDGQNLILLNQDGNQYIGLVYFSKDAARRISTLEGRGIKFVQRRELDGQLKMAVFVGPGGLVVGLNNGDPASLPRPSGQPLTRCGTFGEFAIAVSSFPGATEFWRKMGFSILFETDDPYPWGIVSDKRIVLGLHESEAYGNQIIFTTPALTYFAHDMATRIESLKQDGIQFEKEMANDDGVINNATLLGPDRELMFLFEGEI